MGTRNHHLVLAESQRNVIDPTYFCGALHNGIEHGLHVGRRAADDTEHFRCCRLMLQSLAQFCVTLLDLLEQPYVFDGNDSLVSESFDKRDLFVCEWPKFWATEMDH